MNQHDSRRGRAPTMDELRARYGRMVRDENLWHMLDAIGELEPEPLPENVTPFPGDRVDHHDDGGEGQGRVLPFRRR